MIETVPYPSIADLIWVIGYIPLYIALLSWVRTLQVTPSRRQNYLIVGLSLIWVALTVVFYFNSDYSRFRPCVLLLEGILNLIYPLADAGLVVLASLILILLREGRFSLTWRFIFIGIFIMTVSDLLFTYSTWQELYFPEGQVNALTVLIDTTYSLAYICVGLGIFIYRYIWDIKEKFKVNSDTLPTAKFYAFLSTNQDNLVIACSDNFLPPGQCRSRNQLPQKTAGCRFGITLQKKCKR